MKNITYKQIKNHYDSLYSNKNYISFLQGIEYYYRISHEKAILDLLKFTTFNRLTRKLLLDDGCGRGDWWYLFNEEYRIIGVDISIDQCNNVAKNNYKIAANAVQLPLKSDTIDMVFNSEVIEHMLPREGKSYLIEANRVLKQGGFLIITTPNGMELRRLLQNFIIKILSKVFKENDEYIKSRLFRLYLRFTGHYCQDVNIIEQSGYVGHFNVMIPLELIKCIEESGFEIIRKRFQVLIPPIAWPFHKGKWVAPLFFKLENVFRRTPIINLLFLSNIGIIAKKIS
jgi:ubiquinone/menaquinone biosynthesis C-methylase UbiE